MKKFFLSLVLLIASLPMLAQQQVVIIGAKGDTLASYPVWQVKHILFEAMARDTSFVKPSAVDLGLRSTVMWADMNLGASKPEEAGWLFGWGNPDLSIKSDDLKFFPSADASTNIVSTANDVALYYLGDSDKKWRMPTEEDFEELLKLKWTWLPDSNVYKVSNPTDESKYIYMPLATGYSLGDVDSLAVDSAFYWSGSLATKDSAYALVFPKSDSAAVNRQLRAVFRANRFAVRPVYGEYVMPIGVSSEDAMVSSRTATIRINLVGDGENVEYGILYSRTPGVSATSFEYSFHANKPILESSFETSVVFDVPDFATTYYYRAYVLVGRDKVVEEMEHQFTSEPDSRIVDLGLRRKWARWDIGANAPYQYGNDYVWGCTTGLINTPLEKSEYSDISGTMYDIAHNTWTDDANWCMPSRADFQELFEHCNVIDTALVNPYTQKEVWGLKFTRKNPKITDWLFLPMGGLGYRHDYRGAAAYYWTSENKEDYLAYHAYFEYAMFGMEGVHYEPMNKRTTHQVRAVYGPRLAELPVPDVEEGEDTPTPTPTPDPEPDEPIVEPTDDSTFGPIDLGLPSGTIWANMNVGAEHVYDAGGYYAWGENEVRQADDNGTVYYDRAHYPFYSNNKYQLIDADIAGQASYDPATHKLGAEWQMPTAYQFEELISECTWEWQPYLQKYNNVPGYLVTAKNGKSIFLPAVSYCAGDEVGAYGSGDYWTSTFFMGDTDDRYAFAITFSQQVAPGRGYMMRYYGMPVRPVRAKKK